jgi:hypothetical protein
MIVITTSGSIDEMILGQSVCVNLMQKTVFIQINAYQTIGFRRRLLKIIIILKIKREWVYLSSLI